MSDRTLPPWLLHLNDEDLQLVKRLILASGSLKALAQSYGVSYPTIRLRLDRLIERVRTLDTAANEDPFETKVRLLIASGELSARRAAELLKLHGDAVGGEPGDDLV